QAPAAPSDRHQLPLRCSASKGKARRPRDVGVSGRAPGSTPEIDRIACLRSSSPLPPSGGKGEPEGVSPSPGSAVGPPPTSPSMLRIQGGERGDGGTLALAITKM